MKYVLTERAARAVLRRAMAKHGVDFDRFPQDQQRNSLAGLVQAIDCMQELGWTVEAPLVDVLDDPRELEILRAAKKQ
jgi:hypothetical protein